MPVKITIDEQPSTNNYIDDPENNFSSQSNYSNKPIKKNINYDDILKNMGMREIKGKLFWEDKIPPNTDNFVSYEPNKPQQRQNDIISSPPPQNSYIYNKYFKNEFKESGTQEIPSTPQEYRNMLIRQYLEKKRIQNIKSTKMVFQR